ncbi:MAG: phosphoribosylglycinamide formyltransferase, partial [Candidatus Thermoplasmatota archaeon]|nr:phosphoribosylglycinamide formyltransferase [Candidatus Thermoplasmatota archaeon]
MAMRQGSPENPLRIAVLISGSGSGMEALILHQKNPNCTHRTELVISNIVGVAGLEKAERHNVKSMAIELNISITDKKSRRETHEKEIMEALSTHRIELVILSGYMRILSPQFVRKWRGRLLNIHPSLLPKYPGAHAHRDALADGAKITGCTVHFVDEGMDTGQIIAQSQLEIKPDDDEKSLSERVKILEHELYPSVIDD